LISLFNFYRNPVSYFGKKLDSVDRSRLIRTFDSILRGQDIEAPEDTIEYHKNIRFARIAAVHYKTALLLRCQKLYKKIMSDNYYVNDLMGSTQFILPLSNPEKPDMGSYITLD